MFRYTIRDVLWLTVVVAVLVGWGTHHRWMNSELKAANARTDEVEAFVESMGERVPWNKDRTKVSRQQSPTYFP